MFHLCPQCQKPADVSSNNPDRPFCSDRCRLLDLGGWISEKNRIPASIDEDMENTGMFGPGEH